MACFLVEQQHSVTTQHNTTQHTHTHTPARGISRIDINIGIGIDLTNDNDNDNDNHKDNDASVSLLPFDTLCEARIYTYFLGLRVQTKQW